MNEQRTASILQRLPVILAVTAASYGLPAGGPSKPSAKRACKSQAGTASPISFSLRHRVAAQH